MRYILLLFVPLFIVISSSTLLYANEDGSYIDNPGYFKSRVFMGVYGFYPDYYDSDISDSDISGGAFVYVNVINTIYGNAMIGIGSVYEYGNFNRNVSDSNYKANFKNTNIQLNLAYMTSSNMVNAWGGVGFTLNLYDLHFRSYSKESTYIDLNTNQYLTTAGIDVFVGAEYFLTQNKLLSIFAEGRYSFNENLIVHKPIAGTNIVISDLINIFHLKISIGLAFHF